MNRLLWDVSELKAWRCGTLPDDIAVTLLAGKKQAKRLVKGKTRIQGLPNGVGRIVALPEKKAGRFIAEHVMHMAAVQENGKIAVVCRRKKVKRCLKEIQAACLHVNIRCFKKAGKKLSAFLADNAVLAEENIAPNHCEPQQQVVQAAEQVREAAEHVLAEPVFTLLSDKAAEIPYELSGCLKLLKRNRPKKKTALVELLVSNRHSPETAQHTLELLQQKGYIRIDAAENVRYFNM